MYKQFSHFACFAYKIFNIFTPYQVEKTYFRPKQEITLGLIENAFTGV